MPDHVHLLAEVPPAVALSRLLGAELPSWRGARMAGLCSSWWVTSVGGAPLEVVRRYVESQKRAV